MGAWKGVTAENGTFEKFGTLPSYDRSALNNGLARLQRLMLITFQTNMRANRHGDY